MKMIVEGEECEKEEKEEKYDAWEIKCWANTLMEAAEIQADPEKMKLVQPILDQKLTAVKSLAELKDRARKA